MKNCLSTKEQFASHQVQGFGERMKYFKRWMLINTFSSNTTVNYVRKLADLALYFHKLPEEIKEEELSSYFERLILEQKRIFSEFL